MWSYVCLCVCACNYLKVANTDKLNCLRNFFFYVRLDVKGGTQNSLLQNLLTLHCFRLLNLYVPLSTTSVVVAAFEASVLHLSAVKGSSFVNGKSFFKQITPISLTRCEFLNP